MTLSCSMFPVVPNIAIVCVSIDLSHSKLLVVTQQCDGCFVQTESFESTPNRFSAAPRNHGMVGAVRAARIA